MSATDLLAILEAGNKARVHLLKWGDLEVVFGEHAPKLDPGPPVTALTGEQHKTQSASALEQEELRTREEQIDYLTLADPLRAEELIRDGELEEQDGTDSDESA